MWSVCEITWPWRSESTVRKSFEASRSSVSKELTTSLKRPTANRHHKPIDVQSVFNVIWLFFSLQTERGHDAAQTWSMFLADVPRWQLVNSIFYKPEWVSLLLLLLITHYDSKQIWLTRITLMQMIFFGKKNVNFLNVFCWLQTRHEY